MDVREHGVQDRPHQRLLVAEVVADLRRALHVVDARRGSAVLEHQPEEVAATVAFPVSDDARYIHGAAIPVDGGVGTL